MIALANAKNIPYNTLKRAKQLNAPGFLERGSIDWRLLEPWLSSHKAELESTPVESIEEVKLSNEIKRGVLQDKESILKDLEIAKRRSEYLDPAEVREFLIKIATAQSSILNSRLLNELPQKLVGQPLEVTERLCKQLASDIINVFKQGLDQWKP